MTVETISNCFYGHSPPFTDSKRIVDFMINLHESIGLGRDEISPTRYRLPNRACFSSGKNITWMVV